MPLIFWVLEQSGWALLALPTAIAAAAAGVAHLAGCACVTPLAAFLATWAAVPTLLVLLPVLRLVVGSYAESGAAEGGGGWEGAIEWSDPADAARWAGRRIPMEVMYEAYMAGRLDFAGDVYETLLARRGMFRFCITCVRARARGPRGG
jgi:hypothetical protein